MASSAQPTLRSVRKHSLPLLLLLASDVLSPGLVRAQPLQAPSPAPLAPPSCETNPACLSLYDQAREQSERRNLPEALRLYQLAYQVRADPKLLFNIARLHHKLDQIEEAAKSYQRFIDSPLDDPGQKQKARDYLAELEPPPSGASLVASPPPPREERKPIYKKWWFWTILGTAAAAGIAGGVAGGVLANQQFSGPTIRPF